MTSRNHVNQKSLVNPSWKDSVAGEPLMAFSPYLSTRVNVLRAVADEVLGNLDQGFVTQIVDGSRIQRAEALMWLWTLGAYEVVRTMCQAKVCFSQHLVQELCELKTILAEVRMPAAKMEKPRRSPRTPIRSDRSPSGLDSARKDLLVGDPSAPSVFARDVLARFDSVFSSIASNDILSPHGAAYAAK